MAQTSKKTARQASKKVQKNTKSTSIKKRGRLIKEVQKRSGQVVPFDIERIAGAIHKAMIATGEGSLEEAEMIANSVYAELVRISKRHPGFLPTVEGIQNTVEKQLMHSDYLTTAKSYILYREKRSNLRYKGIEVPEKVKKLAQESKKYFRDSLGEFVYYRTYSNWIEDEGRRETWVETVDRYVDFMRENLGDKLTNEEYAEVREAVQGFALLGTLPSGVSLSETYLIVSNTGPAFRLQ